MNKGIKFVVGGTALATTAVAACVIGVEARQNKQVDIQEKTMSDEVSEEELIEKMTDNVKMEEKDIFKNETVYVFADSTGKIDDILVNEVLKNSDGANTLVDKTDLKDIKNIKGDETFTVDGDTITWQANGNDITYQGKSDKKLPVDIKVSYYLDGKEIKPEQLAGASGNVTIRFDYKNKATVVKNINGRYEDINVPFVAVTGCILGDNFTNINVTNGKVMDGGDGKIVVGYAMPGLLESIKSTGEDFGEKINVPEFFEINADVTDFSLDMTATVLLDGSAMNIGGQIDLSSLDDLVGSLSAATNQLVDGTKELSDGTSTLLAKMGEFNTGVNELKAGTDTLSGSSSTLINGINTIDASANSISTGISSLDAGLNTPLTAEAKNEAASLATTKAQTAVANEMVAGNPLYDGIVASASEQFKQSISNEETKSAVAASLNQSLASNNDLYGALYTGVYELAARNTAASYGMSEGDFINYLETPEGAGAKAQLEQYAASSVSGTISSLSTSVAGSVLDGVAESGATAMGYGVAEACKQAAVTAAGQAAGEAVISGIESTKATIAAQIESVQANGYSLVSGAKALAEGTTAMNSKTPALMSGISRLVDGANALSNGSAQLVSGVGTLNNGAQDIKDGMIQYNTEAISKIVNSYNGDIKSLVQRLSAVAEASSEYDTYTMLPDGYNGTTKFIIKTAGISAE